MVSGLKFNNKYLCLWTKVLLKLTVVHTIKNALTFRELGSPAPRFITAATEKYSEPDESSLHPSTLLLHSITFIHIVIFSSHLRSPGSIVGIVIWRRERRPRSLGSTAERCSGGTSNLGVKLTTQLHLVSRLRMSGSIPYSPHTLSKRVLGQP